MKPTTILLAIVIFAISCKKPEPECYVCQMVKNGKIQPGTETRCGSDVPTWAMTMRIAQPEYYPVCARK